MNSEIAAKVFESVTPLYGAIILGFIAGKYLKVEGKNIANLMFYIFMPVVFINSAWRTEFSLQVIILPIVVYFLCCLQCLIFYNVGRFFWRDSHANMLGLMSATANSGYFGLPIAFAIFTNQGVGIYMSSMIGMTVFESSLGMYLAARGAFTARESFIKTIKMPSLYAFIIGTIFSVMEIRVPSSMETLANHTRSTYIIIGMMLIGLGIANMSWRGHGKSIPYSFTALFAKHISWPVIALLTVSTGFFDKDASNAILLLSLMPIAANSVAIAAMFDTHTEKVAFSVLLSVVIASFLVPIMISFMF